MYLKRNPVTRTEVFAIADELAKAGLVPTQRAVIQRVGGSYSTIGHLLAEWRKEQRAANDDNMVTLPDALADKARSQAREMWDQAMAAANATIAADRDHLDRERVAMETDRGDLQNHLRAMEDTVERSDQRVRELEAALLAAQQAQSDLREKLAGSLERCHALEARRQQDEARLADLTQEITELGKRNNELVGSLLSLKKLRHSPSHRANRA